MSWNDLRKGRFSQPKAEYFITFNTHNRQDIFTNYKIAQLFCKQIVINEQKHHRKWLTWVLMPDHFHGLLRLGEKEILLSKVIAELKGSTAYIINAELDRKGKLWQTSFYDHALRKEESRKNIARYIVANPLRKGLVKDIKNYPYWNSIYL
ncbi:REP-associated tyrosine transposase [Thalassotalea profundi]|uniref:Transposase n=1 Tax=Thalassotalea profundi TaxID=2036687 RepID=A0ABQ3IN66_9GAMM|nr:transposase [Thalassotalea profundi]GHE85908.1 transposase [Thalassotalea profundi]